MPTIFELIERVSFLRGLPAVYVLLGTAVFIIIVWDWRLTLLALAGQYLAAGLLFVDVLDPRLAIVKVLTGWFVCLILYMTARQVDDKVGKNGRLPAETAGAHALSASILFRFSAAMLLLAAVWTLARRPGLLLPALPAEFDYLNLAVYELIGMGLLGVSLTADPLRAGTGIFMLMTGFELYYSVLEQSVAMLVMLAVVNMVLALVISFLVQARYAQLALAE